MRLTATCPGRAGATVAPRFVVATLLAFLFWPRDASSQPLACRTDTEQISRALLQIRNAVDPCGESAETVAILDQLERCPSTAYQICVSTEADRNVYDRPHASAGDVQPGTITWNPALRNEIEAAPDGGGATAVRRDPTASLLHELVHAVQECSGLNPGEHELEAVRIENIYRRAAGLAQRRGYGDVPLPPPMMRLCAAGNCPCSPPPAAASIVKAEITTPLDRATRQRNGDRPE